MAGRLAERQAMIDRTHALPIARQAAALGISRGAVCYTPRPTSVFDLTLMRRIDERRCIGWAMRDTMEVELALDALRMARDARHPAAGLIFHSDRGGLYASAAYRTALAAHGMIASKSGKGDCYDNAVAESFFPTLEFELLRKNDWETRDAARCAIFRYIETWYNRKRRHSTLGSVSVPRHFRYTA